MADWTIAADMKKLKKVLEKFEEKKIKGTGDLIAWASLGLVADVAQGTPVRYGQARAGWLPFLWKNNVDVGLEHASGIGLNPGEVVKRQKEGLRACKHKSDFTSPNPEAIVTNNVGHIVYLEYGVRKGGQKAVKLGKAKLSAVSGQMKKGFVRDNVKKWHKDIKKALGA